MEGPIRTADLVQIDSSCIRRPNPASDLEDDFFV